MVPERGGLQGDGAESPGSGAETGSGGLEQSTRSPSGWVWPLRLRLLPTPRPALLNPGPQASRYALWRAVPLTRGT